MKAVFPVNLHVTTPAEFDCFLWKVACVMSIASTTVSADVAVFIC